MNFLISLLNIVKDLPAVPFAVKCTELPTCPLEFQQQLEQQTFQLEQSRPSPQLEEAEAAVRRATFLAVRRWPLQL